MTRLCGECSSPCKKHGVPRRMGAFIDQIVTCPKCGWCGVETEITHEEAVQLDMFAGFDLVGLPVERDEFDGEDETDADDFGGSDADAD